MVRQARYGQVGLGAVRQGTAGVVRLVSAGCGKGRHGLAGVAWWVVVWLDRAWLGRYGWAGCGTVRHGKARQLWLGRPGFGLAGLAWQGMAG